MWLRHPPAGDTRCGPASRGPPEPGLGEGEGTAAAAREPKLRGGRTRARTRGGGAGEPPARCRQTVRSCRHLDPETCKQGLPVLSWAPLPTCPHGHTHTHTHARTHSLIHTHALTHSLTNLKLSIIIVFTPYIKECFVYYLVSMTTQVFTHKTPLYFKE